MCSMYITGMLIFKIIPTLVVLDHPKSDVFTQQLYYSTVNCMYIGRAVKRLSHFHKF